MPRGPAAVILSAVIMVAILLVSGCCCYAFPLPGIGRFVFVEHHLDKSYSAPRDSGFPPMPLLDPLYRYDPSTRTLTPLLQPDIKNAYFTLLYGQDITAQGYPVNGEESFLFPVKQLPAGTQDSEIDTISEDGTVSLTYLGQQITLKPGETWSAQHETTETFNTTVNGSPRSVTANVTVNDSITNYGFMSRSNIQ